MADDPEKEPEAAAAKSRIQDKLDEPLRDILRYMGCLSELGILQFLEDLNFLNIDAVVDFGQQAWKDTLAASHGSREYKEITLLWDLWEIAACFKRTGMFPSRQPMLRLQPTASRSRSPRRG